MRTTAPLALCAIIAAAPAIAHADSAKPDGTFIWKGDVGGSFDGKLVITPGAEGLFAVTATEERSPAVEWRGVARLEGKTLTISREKGIVEVVDRAAETGLVYVATFDGKFEKANVRVLRGEQELGRATLEERQSFWQRIPGELIGLAKKEVDKAVHKEIDLSKEFHILSYGHIGIRAAAELLEDGERSPFMVTSDELFRAAGKGEPIWIRTTIEGGPRIAYSTSIPIDGAGSIRVDAGFSLGGFIRYTCDDQYTRPANVKDAKGALQVLEDMPARVFNLPLTASRAEELAVGTRRSLDGQGALALSGGVSFGYRLEELGALEKKATVGINAGLGVTWNIRGDLRLEVERQRDKLVRVRWTKGSTRQFGAGVNVLLGFYVSQELLDKLKSPTDKVVNAVVKEGERYTTVTFNASADWLKQNELAIDMIFDLSDGAARTAYERAVVGDLLAVQALADSKTPTGLKDYKVTSTLTDALSFHAKFAAFRVLSASTDRTTRNIHVEVAALDGATSTTDIMSYERSGKGLFGDSRTLTAEALTREVVRPNQPVANGQRVTFHFAGRDDMTWKSELLDTLRLGALLFGAGRVGSETALISNHEPGILRHYGKTDMTLDVTLGSAAIEKVLSVSYEELLQAYGRAHWEKSYDWTPARAELLRNTSLQMDRDNTTAEEELRKEAWDFYDAEKVLKLVVKARRTGTSMKDRVAAFRDIAKKDGFKLRAVVAFAVIAGEQDARTAYTLKASSWMGVNLAKGEVRPLPEQP